MCSLLQCVFKIMYMHSQCGSVIINAFLQYSHVGECAWTDRCNAACQLFSRTCAGCVQRKKIMLGDGRFL